MHGDSSIVVFGIIAIALIVLMIASLWKIFVKAGRNGWESIIPIYNMFVEVKIAGLPGWVVILLFIPYINGLVSIYITIKLAGAFGKGLGFTLGMILLPIIFFPILAFDDSQYQLEAE